MKIGVQFDENGEFVGDFLEGMTLPEGHFLFTGEMPDGLYRPKLVDDQVVEGFTQAEIDIIKYGTLEEQKQNKIQQLKLACTNAIHDGFVSTVTDTNGVAYEFGLNDHDQLNFNSQLNKLNLWKNQLTEAKITQAEYDAKFPLKWKTKNMGVVNLTEEQFVQVTNDAEAHLLVQQNKFWTLEAQVNAAIDKVGVDAVVWT